MNEAAKITGTWVVSKYASEADFAAARPYAEETFKNLLTTVGLQAMGRLLTNQGSVTPFSNANAYIGVGNGTAAANVAQTDLQGASKTRAAMDATYPTDPTGGVWVFRATFGSAVANHAWEEFGVFNASSSGIMLNRALSSQGTKISGQVWVATATITVS